MTAKKRKTTRPIRVGVVGVGRGAHFARGAANLAGLKLVALCDTWEERLGPVCSELGVIAYSDYDRFLEHDMDAVILANYFHEHAPFAIKALKAGMHVMSETSACFTLGEGVALIEAVEKSGKIYMFAENYPYTNLNQEMRRLFSTGIMGRFQYGEGEYVHPMTAQQALELSPGVHHWRNWIPATYYCTHALAPVMFITDTMPSKANGFVITRDREDPLNAGQTVQLSDQASVIVIRMDNGAVVKLLQISLRGHGNFVRIHGARGLMEHGRGALAGMLRVRREPFDKKKGEPEEKLYRPDFPEYHEEAAREGHGGGDFFMNYHFAEAIRTGKPPYFDVYKGVSCSIVGILAYRSALNDSNAVEVPDLRKKSVRAKYRNDTWNPHPTRRKKGDPWPSIVGKHAPHQKGLRIARKVWRQMGYTGE